MSVAFLLSASSRVCRHHGSSPESQKACYKRISQSITDHRSHKERAQITEKEKERARENENEKSSICVFGANQRRNKLKRERRNSVRKDREAERERRKVVKEREKE